MKTPPIRPTLLPTPSGLHGRPPEPPMHPTTYRAPRQPLSILQALALSLATTGCFNPLVTLETDDNDSESATTDTATGDADSTDAMSEPDSGSGDGLTPVCGNGVVEDDEVCDDGVNDGSYGGCNADCTAPGPFCGDGVLNGEEPCDDGDDVDGNGCNVDCVVSGTVLWTVTYDGPDHEADLATAVAVDSADNIVVTGRSTVGEAAWTWLAKYTSDGRQVWSTTHAEADGESGAHDVAVLPNDDIIAVGSSDSAFGSPNAWIRRYSPDGDTIWTQTHNGAADELDSAEAVVTDAAGNIYVVISEGQVAIGNGSVHMIRKYTGDGQEVWTTYEPTGVNINDIGLLPSGSLLVAARVGEPHFWTPVLEERNSDGGLEWQIVRDDLAPGWYSSVDANSSGEIALVLDIQGENNSRIFRLGPDLEEIWSDFPWGFDAGTTGVIIDELGWISATGGGGQDFTFWTQKYRPDGQVAWTDTYNGPEELLGIDQGHGVARDSLGNVISVGVVMDDEATLFDARVQKFAP